MPGRALLSVLRDRRGTMAIETAVVAPMLIVMALGTFEVGSMVSRQQELQSAASEAEAIILAAAAGTGTESDDIEAVIEDSLGLDTDQVTLEQRFRCNDATSLSLDATGCDEDEPVFQYVLLEITDQYVPMYSSFGVGSTINYNVERTIQVK